jgi:hypothetical protein
MEFVWYGVKFLSDHVTVLLGRPSGLCYMCIYTFSGTKNTSDELQNIQYRTKSLINVAYFMRTQ